MDARRGSSRQGPAGDPYGGGQQFPAPPPPPEYDPRRYPPPAYDAGAYPAPAYEPTAYDTAAYPAQGYRGDGYELGQERRERVVTRQRQGRGRDARREGERRSSLTPGRILFLLAAIASFALVLYGFLVERGGLQLPIMVSGLVMGGLSLIVLAALSLASLVRAGQDGSGRRAFGWALFGGLSTLAAAGAFAAAVILVLLLGST